MYFFGSLPEDPSITKAQQQGVFEQGVKSGGEQAKHAL